MYDLNNLKIKVRAWIPEENKMIYSDHEIVDYELEGVYFWQFNKFGNLALFKLMDTANNGDPHIEIEVKEAVVMPYVNKDDTKMNSIFCGDIVCFEDWEQKKQTGVVEYSTDDEVCGFCIVYDFGNIMDFNVNRLKVIGNVYENWNLLDESLV